MPYPISPFREFFDSNLIRGSGEEKHDITIQNLNETLRWLCTTPTLTTIRVNTLKTSVEEAKIIVQKRLEEVAKKCNSQQIEVEVHPVLSEVLQFKSKPADRLVVYEKQIIIDSACAAAVLRGANIFAPGVIGMPSGTAKDENVSIYADISRKCKKGYQKLYTDPQKVFIGNGVVLMTRHELFAENLVPVGVAIEVRETISGCPPIGDDFGPKGYLLLQNLPSVACSLALEVNPNDHVLDMCASPGNKTTHLAALMKNQGILVAIDKTSRKVEDLETKLKNFSAKALVFQADSTKILDDSLKDKNVTLGPPFAPESFDKVLLDAPCSVLGKRPQLSNTITEKELNSYAPLQKKLFRNAVGLLKRDGTLIYSTCTITLSENEGLVSWALKTFPCLKLVKPNPSLGSSGWKGTFFSEEEANCVQRYDQYCSDDTVGFFIAKFVKYKN